MADAEVSLTLVGNHGRELAAAARPAVENVVILDRIDSTHIFALRLIEQAEGEDLSLGTTLVIAGRQDEGVGRNARRWFSPTGGLYLSWLTARLEPSVIATLPMIAAAAAHEAVSRLGVENATIKWPNDILVDGRKLAGILIHVRHGASIWAAVGIGINLDRAPVLEDPGPTLPTAVADHLSVGNFGDWAERFIRVLTQQLAEGIETSSDSVAGWRAHLVHRTGDEMAVRLADGTEIRGRFAGVNDQGHLRLDVDGAERVITTGDVFE